MSQGQRYLQAANDIAIADDFWPTLKRMREAAYQVQIHNGQSAAPNHWKDDLDANPPYWGIFKVVSRHGRIEYDPLRIDSLKSQKPVEDKALIEAELKMQEIDARTGGNWQAADYQVADEILTSYQANRKSCPTGANEGV